METSARYILIGLFGIAAITGAFLFVYWLKAIGEPGERVVYRVQFEHTVSGLRAWVSGLVQWRAGRRRHRPGTRSRSPFAGDSRDRDWAGDAGAFRYPC